VCGIVFFFLNLPFLAVLLISTLVTAIRSLVSKRNPDCRYAKDFKDDRTSFMPTQFSFFSPRKDGSIRDVTDGESIVARNGTVGESKATLASVGNGPVIAEARSGLSIANTEQINPSRSGGLTRPARVPFAGISSELADMGVAARGTGFRNVGQRSLSHNISNTRFYQQPTGLRSFSILASHDTPPPGSSGTSQTTQTISSIANSSNTTNMSRSSDVLPLHEIAIACGLGSANGRFPPKSIDTTLLESTSSSPIPQRPRNIYISANGRTESSEEVLPSVGVTSQGVNYAEYPLPAPHVEKNYNDSVAQQHIHVGLEPNKDAILMPWDSPAVRHEEQVRKVLRKGGNQEGYERGGYGSWWKGSFGGK
jgi:hypothetical protein